MFLRKSLVSTTQGYLLAAVVTTPLLLTAASLPASTGPDGVLRMEGVVPNVPAKGITAGAPDAADAAKAMAQAGLPGGDGERSTVTVEAPKGERVVSESATGAHDIPLTAVEAYKRAEGILADVDPECGLRWTLLAGIGRVESNHGRYGGATLGTDGVSDPLIIGVPLNGVGPVAEIHDTDNGQFDQDTVWDRAVGPMQFIPSTWAVAGVDGDGDDVRSPNDIDDAALAAAVYLCAGSEDLRSPAGTRSALLRYNNSSSYASLVMAFQTSYRTGNYTVAGPAAPAVTPVVAPAPADSGTKAEVVRAAGKVENKNGGRTKGISAPASQADNTLDAPRPDRTPVSAEAPGAPRPTPQPDWSPSPKPVRPTPPGSGPTSPAPNPQPTPSPSPSDPAPAQPDPSPRPGPSPVQEPGPEPAPEPVPAPAPGPSEGSDPAPQPNPGPEPVPAPEPAPGPDPESTPPPDSTPASEPSPTQDPGPSPQPPPSPATGPTSESGVLQPCGDAYCLGASSLELGGAVALAGRANGDFDGDGVVEDNAAEFAGLSGTTVTLTVDRQTGGWVVLAVNGQPY